MDFIIYDPGLVNVQAPGGRLKEWEPRLIPGEQRPEDQTGGRGPVPLTRADASESCLKANLQTVREIHGLPNGLTVLNRPIRA